MSFGVEAEFIDILWHMFLVMGVEGSGGFTCKWGCRKSSLKVTLHWSCSCTLTLSQALETRVLLGAFRLFCNCTCTEAKKSLINQHINLLAKGVDDFVD